MSERPTEPAIRQWCTHYLAEALDLAENEIDPDAKFARLGMDSSVAVTFVVDLEEFLGIELSANVVFDHPTIAELAKYVAQRVGETT